MAMNYYPEPHKFVCTHWTPFPQSLHTVKQRFWLMLPQFTPDTWTHPHRTFLKTHFPPTPNANIRGVRENVMVYPAFVQRHGISSYWSHTSNTIAFQKHKHADRCFLCPFFCMRHRRTLMQLIKYVQARCKLLILQ